MVIKKNLRAWGETSIIKHTAATLDELRSIIVKAMNYGEYLQSIYYNIFNK